MIVEFTPTVVEARIYETGGYKERSAYVGSFTVHITGDEAHVTLLTGTEFDSDGCYTWTKHTNTQMQDYLRRRGVRWLNYECKGRKVRRDLTA